MKISINRAVKAVVLFIALVLFDLFTKSAAVNALSDGRRIPLIPGALEFYYIQNRGAAFGMFQNGTFILSLISLTALIVLTVIYLKVPDGKKYLPLRIVLLFISAGAAGNLYDRLTLKYVRDFIYFSLIHFPVFNLADVCVSLSTAALVILVLFFDKGDDIS